MVNQATASACADSHSTAISLTSKARSGSRITTKPSATLPIPRMKSRRTVLLGAAMGGLGFVLYALAPNGYWFWAAMPVAAMWAVAGPATQSLMTARVSPQEQGRLQGAIGGLNSIAGILGPTLFTQTLAFVAANNVQGPLAGATFLLAGAMVTTAGLLAWHVTKERG
mgnify:CR=1 FL=1